MRPVVNTEKHIVQHSLFAVASGAVTNIELVKADAAPAGASEVRVGSRISAVYIEMWLTGDDSVQGSCVVSVEKTTGGQTVFMTAAQAASLHTYGNKKNIFHTQMGLLPPNTQYPMQVIKGWIKIPKSKQRFGLLDRLILNILGQSDGVTGCGITIYKEQF